MNVAVVCRKKGFDEARKKLGWFSYPVPDLEWAFYPVEDGQAVSKRQFAKAGHDAIVWEDWCAPAWQHDSAIPIYAVIVDSNTSPRRRRLYLDRAKAADVLLIDQDKLTPFAALGKPTYRWQYAVNEQVFAPQPKSIDVAYHVARTDARRALIAPLQALCQDRGYALTLGGKLTIYQLANRYGAARIVVHKSTFEQCRSHRFFDALAAGSCLLTDRVWAVPEDGFISGRHFVEWKTPAGLLQTITDLLESGRWYAVAQAGQAWVLAHHTWRTRAAEFVRTTERVQKQHA